MPGPLTLGEIVARLNGRLVGKPDILIRQVGTLDSAGADEISFLINPRYRSRLETTAAGAVIVGEGVPVPDTLPHIIAERPHAYYARVSQLLNPPRASGAGVDPSASIAPGARVATSAYVGPQAVIENGAVIGERASIGAGCFIGAGASVGNDAILHANVVLCSGSRLGARVVIHPGAVIGSDGFGMADDGGRWIKVPQIGNAVLGDDVEVGANTTIDRGAIGDTVIEDGVKLDNQIQVAHNVRIGAHTVIAGCVGIAGSTRIGRHCMIGGAAMIAGHLDIADRVVISGGTLVSHSLHAAGTYTAVFPIDEHRAWVRNAALVRQLGRMERRLRSLERRLEDGGPVEPD